MKMKMSRIKMSGMKIPKVRMPKVRMFRIKLEPVITYAATFFIIISALIPSLADSIWKDKNPFSSQASFKVGSIITVLINEKITADYKFQGNRDENLRIRLYPDKNMTPFLPSADHNKNFSDKG